MFEGSGVLYFLFLWIINFFDKVKGWLECMVISINDLEESVGFILVGNFG